MRALATIATFAVMFAFGWFLKWLFQNYAEFGFGMFAGITFMAVGYYLAELAGPTEQAVLTGFVQRRWRKARHRAPSRAVD